MKEPVIPLHWERIDFDEAVILVSDRGIRIKQKEYLSSGLLPVIDQGDSFIGGYTNEISAKVDADLPVIIFGDHTRRLKLATFPFAVGADGVKLFNARRGIDPHFLFKQLHNINLEDRGYGRHYQHLRKSRLYLPPLAEQARIVAKLEELLSDLDAGVAELKAAQRKLAQYRQSLLKAAVEGALTAQWRALNPPSETGAQLLDRILKERRARWEAKQLEKFEKQGRAASKEWHAKYPDPIAPDATNLPDLPEGWVWATLDQLTEFITSGSRGWADFYSSAGATFIRSQNINEDWLNLTQVAFVVPPRGSEGARTLVRQHDLLLTITGANVGKAASVETDIGEAYVSQHVALMRPLELELSGFLHMNLISAASGRGQLNEHAYGAGKPGLNLLQVASVCIPLPSLSEAAELMTELNSMLDAATAQEVAITNTLKQAAAQRKNILEAAFSGQLVPQDPHDEPASVLLDRIRVERAGQSSPAKRSRRRASETA